MAYIPTVHPLDTCEQFPQMAFDTLAHGTLNLPDYFGKQWGVVLFYRGVWCGYCRRQLADFQQNLAQIEAKNGAVVAISVDSAGDAKKMRDQGGITYPVAYGANAMDVASKIGCFYEATDL